ncbi:UNVERIFIED_CONTAM: hypothetical protein K2H54_049601 [Gekko kuhli]
MVVQEIHESGAQKLKPTGCEKKNHEQMRLMQKALLPVGSHIHSVYGFALNSVSFDSPNVDAKTDAQMVSLCVF